jgi:hypothetical protein
MMPNPAGPSNRHREAAQLPRRSTGAYAKCHAGSPQGYPASSRDEIKTPDNACGVSGVTTKGVELLDFFGASPLAMTLRNYE